MDRHFVWTAKGVQAADVHARFEAMLLEPLLEPIETVFGGYGEIAAQAFGDALSKAFSPQ